MKSTQEKLENFLLPHRATEIETVLGIHLPSVNLKLFSNLTNQPASQHGMRFYRFDKSYFYKQTIILLYLLSYSCKNRYSACQKIKQRSLWILQQFQNSIIEFQQQYFQSQRALSLSFTREELVKKLKLFKLIITALIKQTELGTICDFVPKIEEFQLLLEVLLTKWTSTEKVTQNLLNYIEELFHLHPKLVTQLNKEKIVQLTLAEETSTIQKRNSPTKKQQKHLLYKRILLKLGDLEVLQIIETNQEKSVFFRLFVPDQSSRVNNNPKEKINIKERQSRITEMILNNRQKVVESEGQYSESDEKSQIVMDDQFYRISSKISSIPKTNMKSLQKVPNQNSRLNLIDSIDPALMFEKKMPNPISEIYTRSSSLEKGNLTFKESLTNSIVLMNNLQLDSLNYKRKKSCENVKSFEKTTKKLDIDNQDKLQIYAKIYLQNLKTRKDCQSYEQLNNSGADKSIKGGNNTKSKKLRDQFAEHMDILKGSKSIGIARSFFRHLNERKH